MSAAITSIGIFDAKTHFSNLLERVSAGESFVITKHGTAIARITPVLPAASKRTAAELEAEAARIRSEVRASQSEIRSWIDDGRR